MSESEGTALSDQLEDSPRPYRSRRKSRPRFQHLQIRYLNWYREYRGECHLCDYASPIGSWGKAAKSTRAHVQAKHGMEAVEL